MDLFKLLEILDITGSTADTFSALFVILRCLFQIPVLRNPGARHSKCNALSRNNMLRFNPIVPQGQQFLIPSAILDLLVHNRPDWGSQAWTSLFRRSLTGVSPQQQEHSAIQGGGST